ncbi:serine/threonine protein kinase [Gemmata sp. G18]|uniref:Serine/threonine protein kinase n=1 Tax=Gemmata palustris TaxID=2822762 RepID=A0ABS5C2F6_9BACT|nr:serine/threonine-protein kinase [Gemmata palustris]MBP3960159.1 serine/threonine protein kinase [Gemmata palustris]
MPDTQPQTAPRPDLTGRTLGDFHILRRIGAGGMGQVYLARQTSLKRDVALKLLRDELNTNLTALARFQAEAQAVAKLNHPNIVHIHQIGEADGLRYMVLEFVEGRNLRDYMARKGPPDLPITLSVVRQVALALQKAHEQGIVHRDIKPENILVTRKVEVKVTDFGLSRFFAGEVPATNITQSGVTLGTPLYMSPEQVQGHTVDNRSDIYSFGVTCYHLLAGEPPFRGTSAFDVALKHVQEKPRPLADLRPDLPADVCGMVHKMMAKNPDDRYQSARDVLRDLVKVRDGLTTGTAQFALSQGNGKGRSLATAGESTSSLTRAAVPSSGHPGARWGLWLLIACACALAAIGGVLLYGGLNPSADPAHAPAGANHSGPGLPDVRSPDRLNTTRERELLVVLNTEGTKPDDAIKASVELGLLYVRERRLPEANERFERLRGREKEWRDPLAARTASVAGRLGLAVVLAHENKPEPSNKLFLDVVQDQPKFGGPGGPKFERSAFSVSGTLLRYPDLSHAVSDALNRNAANLGKTKLEPAALEQLRSPQRVGKKD